MRAASASAFCRAFLEVFGDHGARGNRQKTRVMWLVEAWGVEKFRAAVEAQARAKMAADATANFKLTLPLRHW